MSVQERPYMSRPDEPIEPVELVSAVPGPAAAPPQTDARIRDLERQVKDLTKTVKDRDADLTALRTVLDQVTRTNLEKPEFTPIVEGVCALLCGLVFCRPVDEPDRQRILAAGDAGRKVLEVIAGRIVHFPAARLMYEAAWREFNEFNDRMNGVPHE